MIGAWHGSLIGRGATIVLLWLALIAYVWIASRRRGGGHGPMIPDILGSFAGSRPTARSPAASASGSGSCSVTSCSRSTSSRTHPRTRAAEDVVIVAAVLRSVVRRAGRRCSASLAGHGRGPVDPVAPARLPGRP